MDESHRFSCPLLGFSTRASRGKRLANIVLGGVWISCELERVSLGRWFTKSMQSTKHGVTMIEKRWHSGTVTYSEGPSLRKDADTHGSRYDDGAQRSMGPYKESYTDRSDR